MPGSSEAEHTTDNRGVEISKFSPATKLTNGGCYVIAKRNSNGKPRLTINGLSGKFKRMAELYRMFANDWSHVLDFSDEAMVELYNHESYGQPIRQNNGFMHGKKWLNLNVTMWKEDIEKGLLFVPELYDDPKFPHWWLDNIFKR